MRFNSVPISCFLFASAVLANARRPRQLSSPDGSSKSPAIIAFHGNWGGAIWNLAPGAFNYVHAIFAVPDVASVNGYDSFANVLVVIDGYDCPNNAMLAFGLNFHAQPSGSTSIEAVVVTDPNDTYTVAATLDIPISVGDYIQLDIATFNATTGHVFIDNLTNHRSADQEVQLSYPLCGKSAGWIVSVVQGTTLANFGTVIFTGASAGTRGGRYYQPYGATLIQTVHQDRVHVEAMGSTITFSDSATLWITYLHYELIM